VKYIYNRYRWRTGNDLDEIQEILSKQFKVGRRDFPGNNVEISLFKEDRVELIVTADHIQAHINPHRAVISQIQDKPFTKHDMDLREIILELYPRSRPTPFPWGFSFEPGFEVEE